MFSDLEVEPCGCTVALVSRGYVPPSPFVRSSLGCHGWVSFNWLGLFGRGRGTWSGRWGHSSIQVTVDVYGHLFQTRKPEAAERTDEVVFS